MGLLVNSGSRGGSTSLPLFFCPKAVVMDMAAAPTEFPPSWPPPTRTLVGVSRREKATGDLPEKPQESPTTREGRGSLIVRGLALTLLG